MEINKLKESLIARIIKSEDSDLLEALDALLYSEKEELVIELTDDQIKEINGAKAEIEKGISVDNLTFEKEVKLWLKGR